MDVALHRAQDATVHITTTDIATWLDIRHSGNEVTLFFDRDPRSLSTDLDVLVDFTRRLHDEAVRTRDEIRSADLSAADADLPVTCLHCGFDVVLDDGEWAHLVHGQHFTACYATPDSDHAEPHPEDLARIEHTQPAQSTTTTPAPLGPPDDSWAHDDEG